MEQDQNDYKLINIILIVTSIGMIIGGIYFGVNEIFEARTECHNINGTYKLKNFVHLCNGLPFNEYSYCSHIIGEDCIKEWRNSFEDLFQANNISNG